jgi:hypothetical protein
MTDRSDGGQVSAIPAQPPGLEETFPGRGFEVDHGTINRWVLAYAPVIEKRLHQFRRPHCGSVRIGESVKRTRFWGELWAEPNFATRAFRLYPVVGATIQGEMRVGQGASTLAADLIPAHFGVGGSLRAAS